MGRAPDQADRRLAVEGGLVGLALAILLLLPCLPRDVPGRGDLSDFFWPMKSYTAARWRAGGLPLWNPLSGCGEPWLAQLQSGVLYPGDLPFLLPWPWGPRAGVALHAVIAAAGMAGWLASLGASRAAVLAGAGLYAGGGGFVSLFPVYNNACTAAFLPWIFWASRGAARGRGGAGLALAAALAFLAGEPTLALAGVLAAGAVALATRNEGDLTAGIGRGRAAARIGVGLLVGVGLTAAATVPFVELLLRSGRLQGTTREEALARPVGPSDLADLLLAPRPVETRRTDPGRGGYLSSLSFGFAPLVLASGAWAGFPGRRRLLRGLALVGALGFLLSLGSRGFLAPFLFDSGILRGVRFPARWFVLTHLFLSFAAAAGLDGWFHGSFRPRGAAGTEAAGGPEEEWYPSRPAGVFAAAWLLLVGLGAAAVLLSGALTRSRDPRLAALAAAAAGLAALLVAHRRFRPAAVTRFAPGLAAVLVVAPLPFLSAEPLAPVPAAAIRAVPPIVSGIPPGGSGGRVFATAADRDLLAAFTYRDGPLWTPGAAERAHRALAGYSNLDASIATARSASPLGNPRRERLLGASLAGGDPAVLLGLANVKWIVTPFRATIPSARLEARSGDVSRYRLPSPMGRVFFARSARAASDDETFEALRRPGFDPEEVAYLEPSAARDPLPPPRLLKGYSVAKTLEDGPERTVVTTVASEPSVLVLTRSYDPGWRARVDGLEVPVRRADLALSAVVVPAGEHQLVTDYRPASFRAGGALSLASLVAWLGLALSGGRAGVAG